MDVVTDMNELRSDITVLRGLIDAALDRGVPHDDLLLHACATKLRERRERLDAIQAEHRRNL